jgi:hypothetical protein
MKILVNFSLYLVFLMALVSCQGKDSSSNTDSNKLLINVELETFKLWRQEDAPQIKCSIDSDGQIRIIKNTVGQYDGVLEILKDDQISKSSVDEIRSLLQGIVDGEIFEYMVSGPSPSASAETDLAESIPVSSDPAELSAVPTYIRPMSRLTLLNHKKLNQVLFGSHSYGGVIMHGPNSERLESLLNSLCRYSREEGANN